MPDRTGREVEAARHEEELDRLMSEKRRVVIGQMADFDFPDLCKKIHDSIYPGKSSQLVCTVCGNVTIRHPFCLECLVVASRAVCDTVGRFKAEDFRQRRVGRISTGYDHYSW